MNLEWYYTFIVLAKYLNYRKASEELFITQPSIYQQIKRLEQHVHAKLFENVGRGIKLTASGKRLLPIAHNLVKTYELSMEEMNSKYTIHLNIVVSPYIATYLMPKFLPILFEQEPDIEVTIVVQDNNIVNSIEDNKFDIGILREKPFNAKVHCEQICEGKVKLIVPNVKENMNYTDEEYYLNNYRILANNHPTYWKETINRIYEIAPQADIITIEDVKVSEQLIRANQGISYLPTYILNNNYDNLLKAIEPKLISSPISFTYLVNSKKNSEIERFNYLFKKFIIEEQNKNIF